MAGPLPHNHAIRADLQEYVTDAQTLLASSISVVGADSSFVNAYKVALAAHAVIEALHNDERPSFLHLSAIIQRIPIHILTSQVESARVDMRRLIELLFLTFYFADHPVEWDCLVRDPNRSIAHEKETPILANAHREPSFYRSYAKERFSRETSGLAQLAVDQLSVIYGELSYAAHAPTATNELDIKPAVQTLKPSEIRDVATEFQRMAASLCIAASAFNSDWFDKLQPTHRAWFDRLIGSQSAKKIRGSKFGLPKLISE